MFVGDWKPWIELVSRRDISEIIGNVYSRSEDEHTLALLATDVATWHPSRRPSNRSSDEERMYEGLLELYRNVRLMHEIEKRKQRD